ncbi:MAG: hypothetical protein LBR36_04470 [Bacteroidales bacterium]|jgi:UDP-N-acetylmuramoylalanine--D-glutamate ligase|nr:hypothetical protein [Bacteroidales bacterium]
MRYEELFRNGENTIADEAATRNDRLIAIRKANRENLLRRLGSNDTHKFEIVTRFRGVNFINDSHACTVNATYFTFDQLNSKIVWMAGGNDVQTPYIELLSHVIQKVKALICIGKNNQQLINIFSPYLPVIISRQNMADAVRSAFYSANSGDTVLLSPACECDDLYIDHLHRGESFKQAITEL